MRIDSYICDLLALSYTFPIYVINVMSLDNINLLAVGIAVWLDQCTLYIFLNVYTDRENIACEFTSK